MMLVMENVTAEVADVQLDQLHYRLATLEDELHITTAFSRMLRELEPLGHDVLPTNDNVSAYWEKVFKPALEAELHGVVLAFSGGECIGATLYTPEVIDLDVPPLRVTAHGLYVVPGWRAKGVAGALQKMAHQHLACLDFKCIVTHILLANGNGLANAVREGYKHAGYVVRLNLSKEAN